MPAPAWPPAPGAAAARLPSSAAPLPPTGVPGRPRPARASREQPPRASADPADHTGHLDPAAPTEPPAARADRPAPGRERWLDVLRAVALVRVFTYHSVEGAGWLSVVYPSMGVMFALGGSLMARSLERTPPIDVIENRLRRLLPPFWLFGLIVVPVMLWMGWSTSDPQAPLNPIELGRWLLPVLDPPGSAAGVNAVIVLWYIRAYLWFVLLSPLMMRAFQRSPWISVLAPILLLALNALAGDPLGEAGQVTTAIRDLLIFGSCWMLGFAHRAGMLRRMHPLVLVGLVGLTIGLGAFWTATHPDPDSGYDLNDIALGQALISAGAVLLLLRVNPKLDWLDRTPVLGRLVTVINARAITIYLWHNVAIDLAVPINDQLEWYTEGQLVVTSVVLTALAVLAFGWVEDLAARRPLAILPGGKRRQRKPRRERVRLGPPQRPPPITARRSAIS